jgi:hypothetical protein
MTPKKLEILEKTLEQELEETIKKNQELWNSGCRDKKAFDDHCLQPKKLESEDIESTVEGSIELLQNFLEDCPDKEKVINFSTWVDSDIEYDYNGDPFSICTAKVNWYELKEWSEESFQTHIKNQLRRELTARLQPAKVSYPKTIDCKLLTLFKEGSIDWITLQKLVYSDCEI